MTFVKYEACIYKLSRHATSNLTIEYERVCCFVCGLRLYLLMFTYILVAMGRSFAEMLNHKNMIEKMHCEAQEGSDKRPQYKGCFSGRYNDA